MSHDRMVLHEVCAAAAALVTQPMDVVKTRMQETLGVFVGDMQLQKTSLVHGFQLQVILISIDIASNYTIYVYLKTI